MKIRYDFVSNSSSSSFVFATKPGCTLAEFSDRLADLTVNPNYEHHDAETRDMNKANAFFNLFNYELLFLGSCIASTEETKIAKKDLPYRFNECYEFTLDDWNYEAEGIANWNKVKDLPGNNLEKMRWQCFERSFIDDDEVLHMFHDREASGLAHSVLKSFALRRDKWFEELIDSGKASEDQVKHYADLNSERVELIKKVVAQYASTHTSWGDVHEPSMYFPDTYSITLNTIKNTRNMFAAGCKMKFVTAEMLDEYEKRLRAGEHIYCVHVNSSGSGWDPDAVYAEKGCKFTSDKSLLDAEILSSEML